MQSSRIQEENVSNGGRNAINKTKQTALSLTCICHHTGSDPTLTGKPNQFNQFSNHFVFKLNFVHCCRCNGMKCTVRFRWSLVRRKHKAGLLCYKCKSFFSVFWLSNDPTLSLPPLFQMRPSVITCVSSSRNPSCRAEVHRGHSSGQSHTHEWMSELIHQTVTP